MCFEHIRLCPRRPRESFPEPHLDRRDPASPSSPPTIPPACCFPYCTLLPWPAKRGIRVPSVLCWSVRAKVLCLKSASAPAEDKLGFSGWSWEYWADSVFTLIKTKLTPGAYFKRSCEFRDLPKWIHPSTDQSIVPSNGFRLTIIKNGSRG